MHRELPEIFGSQPLDFQFRGDALEARELDAGFILAVAIGLLTEAALEVEVPLRVAVTVTL